MPPRTVLPIFSFVVFLIGATEFMLSPMLKPLAEAFKTTTDKAAWLVSGYAFAYALSAPIFGWLSDRINRRKLLLVSLLFLFLDGLALTIAPNLAIAVGLRIFGGIASAALIPTIFALVAEIFPSDKQASAMGVVMLGMTAGIAVGPIFAEVLTELFDWQVPFWVNAAGALLFYVLSKKYIPNQMSAKKKSFLKISMEMAEKFRPSPYRKGALEWHCRVCFYIGRRGLEMHLMMLNNILIHAYVNCILIFFDAFERQYSINQV
ncbi:MFS transporter [Xenorhabdus kozodoii]|uniref:Chloramphenicol/florfenicol exporter n=1 Tax=Xenorhabdus kozodoii TaxID=351676 RepID=A0A2D0LF03_9GAMM|nr:MFS transporter [Xenorhabdus kozodoii]PHM74241.1 chloramphenicol/florfenicol exporter [Xenorhabdus kozodoii]